MELLYTSIYYTCHPYDLKYEFWRILWASYGKYEESYLSSYCIYNKFIELILQIVRILYFPSR